MKLRIDDAFVIGRNDGYEFLVGQLSDNQRWVGMAVALDESGAPASAFVLDFGGDDVERGVTDRDDAVRLTIAEANNPENCFGGLSNHAWN